MKRSVPTWVVDGVIAVALLVFALGSLVDSRDVATAGLYSRPTDGWALLLLALQTLPLTLRRRYPVAVLLLVVGAWIIDRGLNYPASLATVGSLVALHAVGSELTARRSAVVGSLAVGVVTAYTVLGSVVYESVGLDDAALVCLTGLVSLYLGREIYQRRLVTQLQEERVRSAERERQEAARAAVADERARISRELHDVVAHQIVVMTVQAEGAGRLLGDSNPRVREALATIGAAGREGLAEMRRMVGLLRTDPVPAAPIDPAGIAGPDPAIKATGGTLTPQPGLAELTRLAERFGEVGLPVSLQVSGQPRRLPGGVDLNAYRIVEESLTNALKHGGPKVSVQVAVTYEPDRLDITVTDDGRGDLHGSDRHQHESGGHGLVGMRERTGLLAGRIETGPVPGGGFRVHASLPVPT